MATHSNILAWRIPMDRGAWRVTDPEVAKSQTQLSDLHFPLLLSVYMIFVGPVPSVGLPWWLSGKESACCCRRHRFDP